MCVVFFFQFLFLLTFFKDGIVETFFPCGKNGTDILNLFLLCQIEFSGPFTSTQLCLLYLFCCLKLLGHGEVA